MFTCTQESCFEGLFLKHSNYFIRRLLPTFLEPTSYKVSPGNYTPTCYIYTHSFHSKLSHGALCSLGPGNSTLDLATSFDRDAVLMQAKGVNMLRND